jgi:hypothetical protein
MQARYPTVLGCHLADIFATDWQIDTSERHMRQVAIQTGQSHQDRCGPSRAISSCADGGFGKRWLGGVPVDPIRAILISNAQQKE